MKLFIVKSNNIAFDEDESMVILSESGEKALILAKENWKFRDGRNHDEFDVIEIGMNKESIVDISHYGD